MRHDAFDAITRTSAYWIGFLMADGCVDDRNYIKVALARVDTQHVHKFRGFLESENKVRVRPDGAAEFSAGSKRLAQALIPHGVVSRKSMTAKVGEQLKGSSDFWRGVVDGDGTVGVYDGTPWLRLCGSKTLVAQFADFARTVCPETRASARPSKSIYAVTFKSRIAVQLIGRLYGDADVALDRKAKLAQEILSVNWSKKQACGERHGNARLTESTVRDIRRQKNKTAEEIARAFGISKSTVGQILRRETWHGVEA